MDNQNVALRRALSYGADLRTRDRAKLSVAQIDHLALMDEIERLARELEEVRKYSVERSSLLGTVTHQGAEIQRLRAALEQIRDYHVIQGMSPALFAEKVLGSSDSAGESNGKE